MRASEWRVSSELGASCCAAPPAAVAAHDNWHYLERISGVVVGEEVRSAAIASGDSSSSGF
jgi:hypothetical protein